MAAQLKTLKHLYCISVCLTNMTNLHCIKLRYPIALSIGFQVQYVYRLPTEKKNAKKMT